MEAYIKDLFDLELDTSNIKQQLSVYHCSGLPPLEKIEDELANRKNPLLIIPVHLSGLLLSESGNFKRNPYGYRPYLNQYFLYHRMVNVREVFLGDERINRLLIIERDENERPMKHDFTIFNIHRL